MKVEIVRRRPAKRNPLGLQLTEMETLAVLHLPEGASVPRKGEYINVEDAKDGECKSLTGFGSRVIEVGWSYRVTTLDHIQIEVE